VTRLRESAETARFGRSHSDRAAQKMNWRQNLEPRSKKGRGERHCRVVKTSSNSTQREKRRRVENITGEKMSFSAKLTAMRKRLTGIV